MLHFNTDITGLECIEASAMEFDRPTETMTTALPLLYQSGHLTIKDYDRDADTYILDIPNKEVHESLLKIIDKSSGYAECHWR